MTPQCDCADAVENRERRHPEPATMPTNDDGEILCRFCWQVLEEVDA